ncbi:MAG: sulfite exporter TauE/SafE family protein [bacterium]|nr:sulfite exporter TauE/SafE family protein [bacterium]
MKTTTDLFLIGITLAWGPCFCSCTPLVLTYLAGTQVVNGIEAKKSWLKGFINVMVFCLARIGIYILIIGIAFLIGHKIIRSWYEIGYGKFLYYIAGFITIIFGIVLLFGKKGSNNFCSRFLCNTKNKITNIWGVALLGIAVGVAPCIPLFGVVNYVVFEAKSLSQALLYAGCFSAGMLLSPLIPLGVIASAVPSFLKGNKVLIFFSYLCGIMLIYFGIKLLFSGQSF